MSTTTTTDETVTVDAQTENDAGAELAGIVAQTLPVPGDLPDFDQFRAICTVSQDTIERVATEDL
jgi:hypothetical protein